MPGASSGTVTAAPSKPFVGMLMLDTGVILARLDPLSLEPVSRKVELGEYHNAWSLSPDGTQLALGVSAPGESGRVGIIILDLDDLTVVREIETGGAAEALAWLTPSLLIGGLVRDGTVVVDPLTGEILHRWPSLSPPEASARTPEGLVMLFPRTGTTAPRLAVVDAQGRLRSVVLDRIQLSARYADGVYYADRAGLAVDPGQARAYVFAADAPVADVDLRTMRVSYHRLEALFLSAGEVGGTEAQPEDVRARIRRALWLGDGQVLVFGSDLVPAAREDFESIAAGATLVDTVKWRSCTLDAKAGGAAFVGGRVLAYGSGDPGSRGLRGYSVQGRPAFHLADREPVWDVQAAGHLAYVRGPVIEVSPQGGTRSTVYVVDVRSGTVLRKIAPRGELVDVVAGPS